MSEPMARKANEIVAAIEREQRQIGLELHDHVCQTLAGTSMLVETIERALAAGESLPTDAFAELRRVVDATIEQTRALSRRYRAISLGGPGLMQALEDLARETPNCAFACEKPVFASDETRALALYRVAQEAVKNAAQHSGAKKIGMSLQWVESALVLNVEDDGKGFKETAHESDEVLRGIGMMKWRAAAVDGELKISSQDGVGTTVRFVVPAI